MQAERAVARPVVHRLKGDQGQPPVNAQLGDFLVLDAVRPAPQDLPLAQLAEVSRQRLGEQDDIAVRQELLMGAETSDMARQPLVGHAETLTVAVLEVDAPSQPGIDPLDVQRVDREPPLALLPRPRHDAEAELIHPRSFDRESLPNTTRRGVPPRPRRHDPAAAPLSRTARASGPWSVIWGALQLGGLGPGVDGQVIGDSRRAGA